jgi:hypothetical protein
MPWECYECTFVQEGSPSGKGPCLMCMHDNPLRIKVEVEDANASPSPAPPKITGTAVKTKVLMSDVAGLNAFLEAIAEDSAAVAAAVEAAAVEESAESAAAVTMMEMRVGGVTILGSRTRIIAPLTLPWTLSR